MRFRAQRQGGALAWGLGLAAGFSLLLLVLLLAPMPQGWSPALATNGASHPDQGIIQPKALAEMDSKAEEEPALAGGESHQAQKSVEGGLGGNIAESVPGGLPAQQGAAAAYPADILQRLAGVELKMDRRAAQRSLFSIGEPARMRRFVHKLLSGERVSVAAVGGSVTAGQGAIYGGSYVEELFKFVRHVSPKQEHNLRNVACGGVTSALFAACINTVAQQDVDFAFIEFTINDPIESGVGNKMLGSPERRAFERLLRKLLEFPNRPAVVLMNTYSWFQSRPDHLNVSQPGLFHKSAENELTVFGQYYALPILSTRAAFYRYMRSNDTGFKAHVWRREHENVTKEEELFYYDEVHPQDAKTGTGHRLVADMLIHLVQTIAADLMLHPLGKEDEEIAQEPLQEPMLAGNYAQQTSSCLLQRDFERVMAEQEGWVFKNEKPDAFSLQGQKWGWIANMTGSWAVLEADTRREGEDKPDETSELLLAFLKSYAHMGRARIECTANCKCEPTEIDSHWEKKASLTEIHRFEVSQHERCRVRVTVLNETSSGEHKVKLSGLMVSNGPRDGLKNDMNMGAQVEIISSST